MANRRYLRYLPPDYADGISVPRQKKNGKFLRSPREISVAVHTDADRPHPHLMVDLHNYFHLHVCLYFCRIMVLDPP